MGKFLEQNSHLQNDKTLEKTSWNMSLFINQPTINAHPFVS